MRLFKKVIKEKAYAKVNLGLKVLKKRDDGYHELEMLMVNIDLYDVLYFRKSDDIVVEMNKDICKMEDNIVYRLACNLKEKYHVKEGINIKIKKNIPSGGGLGGGSSDAAKALIVLNELWELNLDEEGLIENALSVGCDVVFFLYNHLAKVSGTGNRVELIYKELDEDIVLVIPNVKCSTKTIYQNHIINDNDNKVDNIINNIDDDFEEYMFNDLEDTAKRVYSNYLLDDIKANILKIGYKKALMSGSGSTVFGIKKSSDKVDKNSFKSLKKDYTVIMCKTISSCK